MEGPILGYPDYEKLFILFMDASETGLGASLTQAEKNYVITEQECLAIVWEVQHFHKYSATGHFTIVTDHSVLKSLRTVENPTGRRARWIMKLQQYDFEVQHRSGKSNRNADVM